MADSSNGLHDEKIEQSRSNSSLQHVLDFSVPVDHSSLEAPGDQRATDASSHRRRSKDESGAKNHEHRAVGGGNGSGGGRREYRSHSQHRHSRSHYRSRSGSRSHKPSESHSRRRSRSRSHSRHRPAGGSDEIVKVLVSNLPFEVGWRELKDFVRARGVHCSPHAKACPQCMYE